ncbi:MAG: hypothetical protein WD036_02050 [Bauldia sp.]
MRHLNFIAVALLAFLCASSANADPHPAGFFSHKFNGPSKPVTENGITTFQISDEQCSNVDYGDGRGESDCYNGNVRSVLSGPSFTMGDRVEYRFDIRVDSAFAYPGYRNGHAVGFLRGGWDSRLRIASWEGTFLHNFFYMLKLDATNGITFLGQQCQSPDRFGEWVAFSMKVRWAADEKGWIKVSCDDRVIYGDEDVATNQAPHCYITNQCEAGIHKNPKKGFFILGPVMSGFGTEWEKYLEDSGGSAFTKIQPGGITIEIRNILVAKGAVLYEPDDVAVIRQLQERLAALGCDPGKADGAPGKRTRDAALACSQFAAGRLPAELNVATARTFLELYQPRTGDQVAAPVEGALPAPELIVTTREEWTKEKGKATQITSLLRSRIEGGKKGEDSVEFNISGKYSYSSENFLDLLLVIQPPVGKTMPKALVACPGARTEIYEGTHHVAITLRKEGEDFVAQGADCIIANIPATPAFMAKFLLTSFQDIAIGLISSGDVELLENDGLRAFMQKVAEGKIVIR